MPRTGPRQGPWRGWEQIDLPDHAVALVAVLERLRRMGHAGSLLAVGHRIVHGGSWYREPVRIGPEVVGVLKGLVTVDPNHTPQALSAVEATAREFPSCRRSPASTPRSTREMPAGRPTLPAVTRIPRTTPASYATASTGCPMNTSCYVLRALDPDARERSRDHCASRERRKHGRQCGGRT